MLHQVRVYDNAKDYKRNDNPTPSFMYTTPHIPQIGLEVYHEKLGIEFTVEKMRQNIREDGRMYWMVFSSTIFTYPF